MRDSGRHEGMHHQQRHAGRLVRCVQCKAFRCRVRAGLALRERRVQRVRVLVGRRVGGRPHRPAERSELQAAADAEQEVRHEHLRSRSGHARTADVDQAGGAASTVLPAPRIGAMYKKRKKAFKTHDLSSTASYG